MAKSKHVRIGLVQTKVGDDVDANLEKAAAFISRASSKGAEIVCLQELFAMRYIGRTEDKRLLNLTEPIPGRTSRFLGQQAKEHNITLVGGSLYEKGEDGKRYNTSLVFEKDGRMLAKYRKIHIPYDPHYYEQFYFRPGNLGFVQVKIPHLTFAPLICYDQWYPEAARLNALAGAKLILYPTAIGWSKEMKTLEPFSARRWEDAMRSHASMNGIYTAAANRVGREGELTFWGGSFIADPFGQVIARASSSREEALVAEINLDKVSASQQGWGFLQNRRPDAYGNLVK